MSNSSVMRKRVSKKTRSSWRKHSNIDDVETFLERQRQDERIGSFTDKKDEELFEVDVRSVKKSTLSVVKKRKINALKPLKTLSALENTSKIEDPIKKRNIVKQKKHGRNIEEEILRPASQKHIQANKDRLRFYNRLETKLSKDKADKEFSKDIWEEKDVRQRLPGLQNQWISKDLSLYVLKNVGKSVVKVHDSLRHKTTKAKAFEPPHPGTSYNPSLTDHQSLMQKVVDKEMNIIKTEKHLKRVTTDMFRKVTPEEREAQRIKELSSGLEFEKDDDEGIHIPDEIVSSSCTGNTPAVNKKKTKQQRRKQKEQKVIAGTLKKKKQVKRFGTDVHRIKHIQKEISDEEEKLNQLKKSRKTTSLRKKFEPKRLGPLKYRELDEDFNMPENISGNLRNVKPESSLLVDRFKNFQKRNILQATVDVGKRKAAKTKRFTRNSHKEPAVLISKLKK